MRDVAEVVQIGELLERKPRELSGGQRQRVALGRAIIRRPAVFLMDEPLSNLDAKLRLHTRGELKRFQRELATTTIYVTHDQAEAMTLADRVAIMDRGVLQQVGPPKEVYARPANVFVAGFLGSPPMNLLNVRVTSVEGASARGRRAPSFQRRAVSLRVSPRSRGEQSDAILGVRPEEVILRREPGQGRFPARSSSSRISATSGWSRSTSAGSSSWRGCRADYPAEMGERLWFGFDPERAHLFDPISQRRVDWRRGWLPARDEQHATGLLNEAISQSSSSRMNPPGASRRKTRTHDAVRVRRRRSRLPARAG